MQVSKLEVPHKVDRCACTHAAGICKAWGGHGSHRMPTRFVGVIPKLNFYRVVSCAKCVRELE